MYKDARLPLQQMINCQLEPDPIYSHELNYESGGSDSIGVGNGLQEYYKNPNI